MGVFLSPLSMMFIVALYLPWCRYLSAQAGVQPQLYADNLKYVSRDPDSLLAAARFTTGYVRLVGQEPAPSKCVLLSTSREVRHSMKDIGYCLRRVISGLSGLMYGTWVGIWILLFEAGHPLLLLGFAWSFLDWFLFLRSRMAFMVGSVWLGPCIFLLHCMVLRLLFLPLTACASFGLLFIGLSGLVVSHWLMLVLFLACWMGPLVVTMHFVWSGSVFVYFVGIWLFGLLRLVGFIVFWRWCEGCPGHGPIHLISTSAAEIGFRWNPDALAWVRPGLPMLSNLAGPIQHFKTAILDAWRNKIASDLCGREGFRGEPLLDVHGSLQLFNSSHVRERDQTLLRSVMVGGVWNGFLLGRVRHQVVPCRFCGAPDGDGHLFWECTFPPLVEIRENPEFHDLMRMDKAHWPRCLLWHG